MLKFLLAVFLLEAPHVYAACSDLMLPATPETQFEVAAQGVVKDTVNQLMWMQCSIGQNWTGTRCSGNANKVVWSEAVVLARDLQYANFQDWRLPNKNELNSIVETACAHPAINSLIFPQTASIPYWTSSPYDNESKFIWAVYFSNGTILPLSGRKVAAVRLVRSIPE